MRASTFILVAGAVISGGVACTGVAAQNAAAAQLAPNQNCAFVTAEHADESAGEPNIQHDGSPLPGIPAPDISAGFRGIPRSAQPPLTASQQRILECSYRLEEANEDMPYTLFIPTSYDPDVPNALVVDLHGLGITPLQQILFDGTTDSAERYGFIVVAPMGYSLSGWWGAQTGQPVETAQMKPGNDERYATGELSEIDALHVLETMRREYNIDSDRIYLMGHSMGGAGTYYLGAQHNDIWAALAPISGAGAPTTLEAVEPYRALPMLIMHGEMDSIVPVAASRRAALLLQEIGSQHLYLEFPGKDHEFWIRRGADKIEKVFQFFSVVSKRTNPGPITEDMLPAPGQGRGG